MSIHTIHDIFQKAFSLSSTTQDHDHRQRSILSFVGQVVHSIDPAEIALIAAGQGLDQENNYPLHPKALSTFEEHNNGSFPDEIVWLGPIQSTINDAPSASTTRRLSSSRNTSAAQPRTTVDNDIQERSDHNDAVVILDSDEEEQETPTAMDEQSPREGNKEQDDGGDASSCVSWSDSDASGPAEGSDTEEHGVGSVSTTMVAVLLNTTTHQGGTSSVQPFKRGDLVEVTKGLMLQQGLESGRVVTCVGISGTAISRTSPTPQQHKRTKLSDEHRHVRKSPIPARASTPRMARKRTRSDTIVLDDDSDGNDGQKSGSPEGRKRSKQDGRGTGHSPAPHFRPWSHQVNPIKEIDPLKFLVRAEGGDEHRNLHLEAGGSVDYISNVWCSLPLAPLSATTTSTISSPSIGTTDTAIGVVTISRHICRIDAIQRVQVRAVCAECENDYKNSRCVFGCGSRKWRAQVQLECLISDGTAGVELRVSGDQEDVMWTLLGLKETNRKDEGRMETEVGSKEIVDDHEEQSLPQVPQVHVDPHEEVRSKVLRIVARRGYLTFKSGPAPNLTASSSSISDKDKDKDKVKDKVKDKGKQKATLQGGVSSITQVKGHVETLDDDRTQRATAEEKLWLDICTVHPRKQQSFVLYASTSRPAANGSTLSSSSSLSAGAVKRKAVLKKSWVPIQKWKTIETLVRPPLVLWAAAAEWIRPHSETRMLLNRLLNKPS
ncbi:hypothetical protein BGX33_009965 [Mortierella sp. NVP41]|nr:hypothetical protein BGX33_009965 [Mortierella sp. NVP41]